MQRTFPIPCDYSVCLLTRFTWTSFINRDNTELIFLTLLQAWYMGCCLICWYSTNLHKTMAKHYSYLQKNYSNTHTPASDSSFPFHITGLTTSDRSIHLQASIYYRKIPRKMLWIKLEKTPRGFAFCSMQYQPLTPTQIRIVTAITWGQERISVMRYTSKS